jgi:hypothetical protein
VGGGAGGRRGREGGRGGGGGGGGGAAGVSQPASMLRLDDTRLKVDKFCLLGRGFITPKSIAALHCTALFLVRARD